MCNREKWRSRWMGIDLVLLARGTAVDKTVNIRGEARPPKLRGNKLASFENSRMTSSGMVMVTSNDRVAQVSISRDIDTALVSQDASIIVPVGEAQTESGRSFARESMEGIKDQWVRSRGRLEFISEGGVYNVNEEFVWEEGDCLIVRVRSGNVIWLVRQGVRSTEIFAQDCYGTRTRSYLFHCTSVTVNRRFSFYIHHSYYLLC